MTPTRWALALLGIVAAAGVAAAQQSAPEPTAPEPRPPAAVPLEPPAAVAEQLAAIESLIAGAPSPDLDLTALFGVDPRDGELLPERREGLEDKLARWRAERRRTLGGSDGAGAAAGDDDSAAELSLPGRPLLAPSDALRVAQFDLLIRRDEARLAFLDSDDETRATAIQTLEDARRLRQEREAAEAARVEAEENARLAEEARLDALERAREARTLAAAELASEQARVEEIRRSVAEQQSDYADQQLRRAEDTLRRSDVAERIETAVASGHVSGARADRLYDDAVDALAAAREALAAALSEQMAETRFPAFEPSIDPGEDAYRELETELEQLLTSVGALDQERGDAIDAEDSLRWTAVDSLAAEVLRLNDARLTLLPLLGDARREAVLGIGPEGLRQLAREATHLQLVSRWYLQARLRSLGGAPTWAFELLGRASGRWNLTMLLVVVFGALPLLRRRRVMFDRLDQFVRASIDDD
ncbi:MAG: hypothetical protein QGH45_17440, partial [Myxococcota bacterium]|nr:hypothetical protein [Myxococcota bacterium]